MPNLGVASFGAYGGMADACLIGSEAEAAALCSIFFLCYMSYLAHLTNSAISTHFLSGLNNACPFVSGTASGTSKDHRELSN
jgi:hypothetical protein